MEMRQKPKTCKWARILGLLAVLALLGGCATGGKVKPDATDSESAIGQGPTVAPLPEGRQGFVIREVPQLGEAARRDFDRAVDLLHEQDHEGAAELLETVVEASPGVTAPYINLAIAYRHLEQPEKAEEHLKKALELVPDHPVACNEFGLLYRKSGRFDEARAMYEQALARFPDYLPAHRNLGILCDLYLGDLECALEHYEIYSRARPGDEQVLLWIADLRMRLGIH
jgi:tetratricopeptide (TPR) repeat protein